MRIGVFGYFTKNTHSCCPNTPLLLTKYPFLFSKYPPSALYIHLSVGGCNMGSPITLLLRFSQPAICEAEDEEHTDEDEDAVILHLWLVINPSEKQNNCIFLFTPQMLMFVNHIYVYKYCICIVYVLCICCICWLIIRSSSDISQVCH